MIDLIVDLPAKGNDVYSDGFKIRRISTECSVSLMTSIDTFSAMVDVMEVGLTPDKVDVISLDDIK